MNKYKVEAYISRVIYNYKAGRTSDKDLVSFNRRIGKVVQSKININHKETQNRTPFYWPCCKSNIDMIKYIMSFPDVIINLPSLMGRILLSKSC